MYPQMPPPNGTYNDWIIHRDAGDDDYEQPRMTNPYAPTPNEI